MVSFASDKEEIREHVTCSMCEKTFTCPQELACFHVFCEKCLKTLPRVKSETNQGFHCPTCNTFCVVGEEKTPYMRNEFVKAFTSDEEKCGMCGKDGAGWNCEECDYMMCDDCKMHHSKMLLNKSHSVVSSEKTQGLHFVINKPIACEVHTDMFVKYYCTICQELICSNCLSEIHMHKPNDVRKLVDAAESFIPVIREKINLIERKNKMHQDKVSSSESQMNELQEVFDGVKDGLDQARQKINAQYDRDVKLLKKCKNKEIAKLRKFREKSEYDIVENNQLVSFTKVTLQNAKNGRNEIDEVRQIVMQKINAQYDRDVKLLQECENKEIMKQTEFKEKNEYYIAENNRLVSFTKVTLQSAKSGSLVKELTQGLSRRIDDAISKKPLDNSKKNKLPRLEKNAMILAENILGKIHWDDDEEIVKIKNNTARENISVSFLAITSILAVIILIAAMCLMHIPLAVPVAHTDYATSDIENPEANLVTDRQDTETPDIPFIKMQKSEFINSDFRHVNQNISEVLDRLSPAATDIYSLLSQADRMALVDDTIWIALTSTHSITVITLNGTEVNRIYFPGYDDLYPRAVLQVNTSEVLLACDGGLYVLDSTGQIQFRVAGGSYHDISKHEEKVVALQHFSEQEISFHSLKYDRSKWISDKVSISVHNIPVSAVHLTMIVYDEFVYISSRSYHKIYKYTLGGGLQQTYGGQGSSVGELSYPTISAVDPWGTVLICELLNDRLQTLSAEGEWREYSLGWRGRWLKDAIIENNTLYVLWYDNGTHRISHYWQLN